MFLKKSTILIVSLMLYPLFGLAQTKDEVRANYRLSFGSYTSYPEDVSENYSKVPQGYKAFYISHYGRHGSRYLITSKFYDHVLSVLNKADSLGVITPEGKEFKRKVEQTAQYCVGKYEDLTLLGAEQQKQIATRMYRNFPEVFTKGGFVECKSSYIIRCGMTMANFCMQLKALKPSLDIRMSQNRKDMYYINPHVKIQKTDDGPAYETLSSFRERILDGSALASRLISSQEFIKENVNLAKFMDACYETARSVDGFPELGIDYANLFTPDEWVALWQGESANWYTWNGYYPGSTPQYEVSRPLLDKIIEEADAAIEGNGICADLRFGHDSKLGPLTYLMQLDGFHPVVTDYDKLVDVWSSGKVVPMGANVQIIFFRNKNNPNIIVKILMNEKECTLPIESRIAPFYEWNDVKKLWQ